MHVYRSRGGGGGEEEEEEEYFRIPVKEGRDDYFREYPRSRRTREAQGRRAG